jgi:hypothetical protein
MQTLTNELEPDMKFYKTDQAARRLQIVHFAGDLRYEQNNAAAELGSRSVPER